MGGGKLRKAIGAVKDQTSISLAKVGSSASLSDLDVAIVKSTRHEEFPADERYIREIMSLTCYSRAFVGACVSTISRRLSKTKNWVVALKSLMLIQRLLAEGDPAYEQEIFFATRRGTRLLNMSDFRDTSRSDSWDYSAFVRTYALYLDEHLEFRMQARRGKRSAFSYDQEEEEVGHNAIVVRTTPVREMKNEHIFSRVHHLMQILERFLACRPTGNARNNRIVIVAMYPIVKESFQLYYDITEILGILIDRFMELDIPDSVKVFEIFTRVSKQYDELDALYAWCKTVGICRAADFPDVEKIPQKKLDVMDEFIREKSVMAHNRKAKMIEPTPEPQPVKQEAEEEAEPEEDMNAIKALPPPEGFQEETPEEKQEEEKDDDKAKPKTQDIGDLLNLGEDAPTTEEQGDKLALALFDGNLSTSAPEATGTSAWEAFNDSEDWESALVQSASHLSNQQVALPGGFNTMMLDGMYQQGTIQQAVASSGVTATGSASSVALGSAGRPAMLALPAPPSADGATPSGADPFAASLSVAPPPYVQMSEMEKKQRLLVEEQIMWQKYTSGGMQGQVGLAKAQTYSYPQNTGGYQGNL
ncbi:OLC1v1002561C1 [Oldenlandia corymbosa var. corymbosa]|uniref:OLC1v1002561C1 n=1 Tax=Oldenlandia corymbosa var. corymbosa TaxID=529605 RepID=A0AAV1DBB5_OLDCO|nr:OLC1v1002561C1 [Oldenlandia corymbosa var. corymbosa]